MRNRHRFVRSGFTLVVMLVFLATQLLIGIPPAPAQTTITGVPPLAVPEDPLGQQAEQQIPEVSVGVDVRDGHLVMRVVDVWGPGRVPFIVRSWTGVGNSPAGSGNWQFNHHLTVQANADFSNLYALRADGTLDTYRYTSRSGTFPNPTFTYVKDDRGPYSTMVVPQACTYDGANWTCLPASYTENLPKGMTRQFGATSWITGVRLDGTADTAPYSLITQEQDSNGNIVTYTWTAFTDQDRPYVASVTDPVGRVTTYSYEAYNSFDVLVGPRNLGDPERYGPIA